MNFVDEQKDRSLTASIAEPLGERFIVTIALSVARSEDDISKRRITLGQCYLICLTMLFFTTSFWLFFVSTVKNITSASGLYLLYSTAIEAKKCVFPEPSSPVIVNGRLARELM
jgi:hypothetical protein